MDFRTKLKVRFGFAVGYLVLGIALIVLFNLLGDGRESLSSFGLMLAVIGIAKIRRHLLITRSEKSIERQEIAETDERNIAIANRAKSVAFTVFVLAACVAAVVFYLLDMHGYTQVLMTAVSLLVLIYLVAYGIIRHRS
jgi:uncharacterized membrane protein